MNSSNNNSLDRQSQNLNEEQVICPHCRGQFKRRGLARHIHCAHGNVRNEDPQENNNNDDIMADNFMQQLFIRAFGAPLLNSAGSELYNEWHTRWLCAMQLKGRQYILPQGSVGRQFVDVLTKEIQAIPNGLNITEKVFFLCATVLQRDKMIKNGSDIRRLIKRRLDMWGNGRFDELLQEAERCDRQLKSSQQMDDEEHKIRIFTRLVLQGKLREATRWATDRHSDGVLLPDDTLPNGQTVYQILQNKYPSQMKPENDTFLTNDELPMMLDVDVTSDHIEKVARCLHGSAGPSGTNADQWKSMLLRYGAHSARMREAIASLTRWLANGIVNWNSIKAFSAKRGLALNKYPGIRPIGVGEVLQRLCAKTMALITAVDLQEVCSSDQLCAGTKSGIEGAIHAMSDLYQENTNSSGILLVDASNAFNTISRPLALWNARNLWPRCARFLFNTYQGYAKIMFKGSNRIILSQEGTTQGDPLAMLMYAVGTLPLIKKLKSQNWIQNWYADDSACFGELRHVKEWFDTLQAEGPKWGYFPEPKKSLLLVKSEFKEEAEEMFRDSQVTVVTSHRFLGGIIGENEDKRKFIRKKIDKWVECVRIFGDIAHKSPQAAYAAYTKSLQNEWSFLQRVTNEFHEEYEVLKTAIHQYFTPNLFQQEVSDLEHELFSLPTRYGGLNIQDPTNKIGNGTSYETSRECTKHLTMAIKFNQVLNINDHAIAQYTTRREAKQNYDTTAKNESERLLTLLPERQKRTIDRVIRGSASQWLSVIPTSADHLDLSPDQFRDALTIRYGRSLRNIPTQCDGCDSKFDLTHALNCKKGGLVKHGHDQHRDHCAAIANMAWNGVEIEPVLKEADPVNAIPALQADFKVNGIWEAERVAFFDNRIINADAPSYANQNWTTISRNHSTQKHNKYDRAAEDIRASFTPLICSTEGVVHKEYEVFQKRTSERLANKWNKPYAQVINWMRVQCQISIIRSISLRLRGTRRKIRGLPYEDGAAIPYLDI